ncbi:MAG: ABC transporter ATP-binding protein [Desulfovibrionaceae bacterium]|nr:ABC transporter ATP-binding protein [Desulfovibrionaceae bacterium]
MTDNNSSVALSCQSGYVYQVNGVSKYFDAPAGRVQVLTDVNLNVKQGETLAILGSSGSGKTTLLHLLGMLDSPSQGKIFLNGQNLALLSPAEKASLRNRTIGFVFQFHHLLPEFSTLENVEMPGIIAGLPRSQCRDMAAEALKTVGLEHRTAHRVTTLSGGERQRAAIARAILLGPSVLLADEPTGNLDEKTGASITETLLKLNLDIGMSIIMVTHNLELARLMQTRRELRSGVLYAQNI